MEAKNHTEIKLPHINYMGIDYLVDLRLQEVRPFHYPYLSFKFTELKDEEFKVLIRGIRSDFVDPCYMRGLDD